MWILISKTEKKPKIPIIIIYSLVFYGVWALWEFFGRSAVGSVVSDVFLLEFITEGIIKVMVWVLPTVCLVRYFRDEVYIGLKDMFTNRVNLLKYIPVYLGFTAYLIIPAIIKKGGLVVSDSFTYAKLIGILFVGITEEMVFRGWLLNITVTENRKWLPIIINAVMFLLIHFPIWIASGIFIDAFTSLNFLCVPALSIIFSWSFIKSKNIWIPITLHMYWDLLTDLFY
jgi:membrane protease YdiL (CAAX protease family)